MKKGYKFTYADSSTGSDYGVHTEWELGVERRIENKDRMKLCTESVFHFYAHPVQGLLTDSSHGQFTHYENAFRLMEVEVGKSISDGTKCGTKRITPIRWIEAPKLSKRVIRRILALVVREVVDGKRMTKDLAAVLDAILADERTGAIRKLIDQLRDTRGPGAVSAVKLELGYLYLYDEDFVTVDDLREIAADLLFALRRVSKKRLVAVDWQDLYERAKRKGK